MVKTAAAVLLAGVAACPSNEPPPPVYPAIVFPNYIAVTEGEQTMFQLSLSFAPSVEIAGVLYTQDRNVAYVTNGGFSATPTSYMPIMTVLGVDDMKPAGNRYTGFNGRIEGDAATSGTKVEVVDKDSPNILSSTWGILMPPSTTSTFTVQLTQAPPASTTVILATGVGLVSFMPTTLMFGPSDFNIAQTVTLSSGSQSGTSSISLTADGGLSAKAIVITVTE